MRRYFRSLANPEGAEDPTRCVHTREWAHTSKWEKRQCSRKRGHGRKGLYCRQHARKSASTAEVSAPAKLRALADKLDAEAKRG